MTAVSLLKQHRQTKCSTFAAQYVNEHLRLFDAGKLRLCV